MAPLRSFGPGSVPVSCRPDDVRLLPPPTLTIFQGSLVRAVARATLLLRNGTAGGTIDHREISPSDQTQDSPPSNAAL
jgi:hypothetical protein